MDSAGYGTKEYDIRKTITPYQDFYGEREDSASHVGRAADS